MTNIKVKYLFSFRELLGKSEDSVQLQNPTVENVLEKLFKVYGADFKQRIIDPATDQVRFSPAISFSTLEEGTRGGIP